MKSWNKGLNTNNLDDVQKVNYVKSVLYNNELNDALNTLLQNEKKDLSMIKTIAIVLKDDLIINRLKHQCGQANLHDTKMLVYSRVISILSFYNKTVILNNFFKNLSEPLLRDIAVYEYNNNTDTAVSNKLFDKYGSKYKKETGTKLKAIDEEVLMLSNETRQYNKISGDNSNHKKSVIIFALVVFIVVITIIFSYKYHVSSNELRKYDGLLYPGIYLNEVDLSMVKLEDLPSVIKAEREKIEQGNIKVTSANEDYYFNYKEIGIKINDDNVVNQIKSYNENLPRYKKLRMIKRNRRFKTFSLKGYFDAGSIDKFMKLLVEKLNTNPRNDGVVIDENHNVNYDKGADGFTLDIERTRENVEAELSNIKEESVVIAVGSTVKHEVKYEALSSINKKISSYTTSFLNAGNRGHNINLAASKLNGTVIMPGDEFSYLNVVGPYGTANGYLPAPIYLNSEISTGNGGGVCQLASTLYVAQLKAGLQTIYRTNHTFAPNYVPKGLDATVYSTTVDYKFKNQYEYPIYIVSYVNGNNLNVDIWSNENALNGKTYEPYAVYSNGAYLSYLREIQDGKVISERYLSKSVYKKH